MSDKKGTAKTGWLRTGNRKVIALATVAALTVGGFFGVQAFANSQTYGHMKLFAGYHSCGQGGDHEGFSDISDAELKTRIACMVKLAADEIDATGEQQDKVTALVTAAAMELRPIHDRMRGTGKAIQDLLLANEVDRAALEKLRAGRLADGELISKNLVGVLADVAEVLSPEQRMVLNQRIEQFRSMRLGKHHG